jgi:hypothetical protein
MVPNNVEKEFKDTLLAGGYNLLLGSGVSLDSRNGKGEPLRSAESVRQDLCRLTGVKENTSLTRAYGLLKEHQIQQEIVERFRECSPGPSLQALPRFLWRRLFTFNVDDVIEQLYRGTQKQILQPLNFTAGFELTSERRELQAVHLHGSVLWPNEGFVFATTEYVKVMTGLNPWMHLLAEILATEPFIIAGTSLNEVDLEYYLSYRSSSTPRRGRGPSLLIEPYPDAATRSDCERHGLILIEATFGAFLEWLHKSFPSPPSLTDLVVPDTKALFSDGLSPAQLLRFFSDFELVAGRDRPMLSQPSPFMYGRGPEWSDLEQHFDIERQDNAHLKRFVDQPPTSASQKVALVSDDAGTGKTTVLKRLAHDLASAGQPVLTIRTLSRIDPQNGIACLSRCIASRVVLIADDFADHAEQIIELLEGSASLSTGLVVVAAERSYRQDYVDLQFGDRPRFTDALTSFTPNESEQLLERYRQFGLVGDTYATKHPREFARQIHREPVAIQVCQILNDFRPLEAIVDSLWEAVSESDRLLYLCVALSQFCYSAGIRYSVLQAIIGPSQSVAKLMKPVPLKLASNATQDEFVVAMNATVSERVLRRAVRRSQELLFNAFVGVARGLAPHVNRKAVMRRSPEARLARRLFDADKVVKPLLEDSSERFYVSVQKLWEWNSRYWEQRALLQAETDIEMGLQFARHAVAIEKHPFPLTTLGKLLIQAMEERPPERRSLFDEAFETLSSAIESAVMLSRVSVHPFGSLLAGVARYLELGGALALQQRQTLDRYRADARSRFSGDPLMAAALRRLDSVL